METDSVFFDWLIEYKFLFIILTFIISCAATLIAVAKEDTGKSKKQKGVSALGKWLIGIAVVTLILQIALSIVEERSSITEKEKQQMLLQEKFRVQLDSIQKVADRLLEIQENIKKESEQNAKGFKNNLEKQAQILNEQNNSKKLFENFQPFSISYTVEFDARTLKNNALFDKELIDAEKRLLVRLKNKDYTGMNVYLDSANPYCFINEDYPEISDFEVFEQCTLRISMAATTEQQRAIAKTATKQKPKKLGFQYFSGYRGSVCDDDQDKIKMFNLVTTIMYDIKKRTFEVDYTLKCFEDISTDGTLKSYDDVMNAAISLRLGTHITYCKLKEFAFHFPPNMSRKEKVYFSQEFAQKPQYWLDNTFFFVDQEKFKNCIIEKLK